MHPIITCVVFITCQVEVPQHNTGVHKTLFRIMHTVFHVVGYTDEEALYCTERNRATAFDKSTPYCSIIGMSIYFICLPAVKHNY